MALNSNQWTTPQEISIRTMNIMRGKMCSLVENMNLDNETQEKATIALIKQFSYEAQDIMAQLIDQLDKGQNQFRYASKQLEVKDAD